MSKLDLSKYIILRDADIENWKNYEEQQSIYWNDKEISFEGDRDDYLNPNTPENVKRMIKLILGFFIIGDGLIAEEVLRLMVNALQEKNWPRYFNLSFQNMMENVHATVYSNALLKIIPEEEQSEVLEFCQNLDCIKKKGEWIHDIESRGLTYAGEQSLMACGEGVLFVSLFAIIFYIRKHCSGMFKHFIFSNEQISKDETKHRDQKILEARRSLQKLKDRLAEEKDNQSLVDEITKTEEEILTIVKESVVIEKNFAEYFLRVPVITKESDRECGMTLENLYGYIEMLADQVLVGIGLQAHYKTVITLPWMTEINLSQKDNFYERDRVGNYRSFTVDDKKLEGLDYTNNPEDADI